MKEEALEAIGFSRNEAKTYSALLELGPSQVGAICNFTKLHRTNIYDALERLMKKGAVSYIIKDKIKEFQAAKPSHLMDMLKEKQRLLEQVTPELELARALSKANNEASIHEGVKAFMSLLYGFLEYNEPILVYGIPQQAPDLVKSTIPHFHNLQQKKKIKMKHIYNHNAQERITYLNSLPYTEARCLPAQFDSMVSTNICGNEVVLTVWVHAPVSIRIVNKIVADAYKKYFKLLWAAAKKQQK